MDGWNDNPGVEQSVMDDYMEEFKVTLASGTTDYKTQWKTNISISLVNATTAATARPNAGQE